MSPWGSLLHELWGASPDPRDPGETYKALPDRGRGEAKGIPR